MKFRHTDPEVKDLFLEFLTFGKREAGIGDAAFEGFDGLLELANLKSDHGGLGAGEDVWSGAERFESGEETFFAGAERSEQGGGRRGAIGKICAGDFVEEGGGGLEVGQWRLGAQPFTDFGAGEDEAAENFEALGEHEGYDRWSGFGGSRGFVLINGGSLHGRADRGGGKAEAGGKSADERVAENGVAHEGEGRGEAADEAGF